MRVRSCSRVRDADPFVFGRTKLYHASVSATNVVMEIEFSVGTTLYVYGSACKHLDTVKRNTVMGQTLLLREEMRSQKYEAN